MATSDRPNILWFCTDQQRGDTIHCLGNQFIHTPAIDQLCANGVAFTRAYTQSVVCTPSRASFLTGRYPASHHVYMNGADYFPSSEHLVTKILSDAGYHCGLVGKLHLSRAQNRVERRPEDGYAEFRWSQHSMVGLGPSDDYQAWLRTEKGVEPEELASKVSGAYGTGVPTEYHHTTWCGTEAVDFVRRNRSRTWLLSVNTFHPHPPFDPPGEYRKRYDKSEMPYPIFRSSDVAHQLKMQNIDQQSRTAVDPYAYSSETPAYTAHTDHKNTHDKPPENYDAREIKACYYAAIELIDEQLRRIVEALQETGQLEKTIIIFMSDHGELLGDHGLLYKGCRFYESLVRVPLVISWPQRFVSDLRSAALVELVDIAPTILDAVGIEVPTYMQGKSLLGLLEGKSAPDVHKQYVLCDYKHSLGFPGSRGTQASMYFDGRYKICRYHNEGIGELYDLSTDPTESTDLWDEEAYAESKRRLTQQHFDAMMQTIHTGVARTGQY